jgi:hypothetical protein
MLPKSRSDALLGPAAYYGGERRRHVGQGGDHQGYGAKPSHLLQWNLMSDW